MKKKYIIYAFFLLTIPATVNAQIKIGNYTFKDGGEYTGEMKSRKPNGKGKTVYKNGDAYEGEYVKGLREGYGIYTKKDGTLREAWGTLNRELVEKHINGNGVSRECYATTAYFDTEKGGWRSFRWENLVAVL